MANQRLRMVFVLDRADNPPLFDELIGFRQGVKRLNRLKTLAHEGLIRQAVVPQLAPPAQPKQAIEPQISGGEDAMPAAAAELLGPGID